MVSIFLLKIGKYNENKTKCFLQLKKYGKQQKVPNMY